MMTKKKEKLVPERKLVTDFNNLIHCLLYLKLKEIKLDSLIINNVEMNLLMILQT